MIVPVLEELTSQSFWEVEECKPDCSGISLCCPSGTHRCIFHITIAVAPHPPHLWQLLLQNHHHCQEIISLPTAASSGIRQCSPSHLCQLHSRTIKTTVRRSLPFHRCVPHHGNAVAPHLGSSTHTRPLSPRPLLTTNHGDPPTTKTTPKQTQKDHRAANGITWALQISSTIPRSTRRRPLGPTPPIPPPDHEKKLHHLHAATHRALHERRHWTVRSTS